MGRWVQGKTAFIHALCDAKGEKDVVSMLSIIRECVRLWGTNVYFIWIFIAWIVKKKPIKSRVEDALYSGHLCLGWNVLKKARVFSPMVQVQVHIELMVTQTRRLKIANIWVHLKCVISGWMIPAYLTSNQLHEPLKPKVSLISYETLEETSTSTEIIEGMMIGIPKEIAFGKTV